ncbi:MAG TPA: hypothetical protein DEP60_02615 [Ruminococcaceae bacterium]|jgi:uncharacterized protein YmfQ (DUF2313 family)|nr:hypothetical protein [Oscillospiraceae bacterium]
MRQVDLTSYLPPVLRPVKELNHTMAAESAELNRLNQCTENAFADLFVSTLTPYGIARWEKILGIAPAGTEQKRRETILARIYSDSILNGAYLLDFVSKQAHAGTRVEVQPEKYTFQIYIAALPSEKIGVKAIMDMVEQVKPANMGFALKYEQGAGCVEYFGACLQTAKVFEIKQVI